MGKEFASSKSDAREYFGGARDLSVRAPPKYSRRL